MDFSGHFKTVMAHKKLVMQYCFRLGLYKQGITHDLSKFSLTELLVGAKYYQGDRSPNNAEREEKGYSSSWLHHKGRNRHHFEYWIDYNIDKSNKNILAGTEMPVKYVLEMLADRIAACRTYQKEAYTQKSAWEYHKKIDKDLSGIIHPNTEKLLERLLKLLAKEGEDVTFAYARFLLKQEQKRNFKKLYKKILRSIGS